MTWFETSPLFAELGIEHGFGRLGSFEHPPERCRRVRQVHGATLVRVPEAPQGSEADALFTTEPGQAVAVQTADCVPILLVDREREFAAAIHAGWRGTAAGIATKAVTEMCRTLAIPPERLVAAIGPRIDACCYEVDEPVRAALHDADAFTPAGPGHYQLDLAGANTRQLLGAGLPAHQIEVVGACTSCHPDRYPSHRRDADGRRMLHFARCP